MIYAMCNPPSSILALFTFLTKGLARYKKCQHSWNNYFVIAVYASSLWRRVSPKRRKFSLLLNRVADCQFGYQRANGT